MPNQSNVNITKVRLLNVPLENDYKNTLYFNSEEEQIEYFKSRTVAQYDTLSYQRPDNIIRVPATDKNGLATNCDELLKLGVNYVMFQNTAYSNKWFYAFITDMNFGNNNRTDISIEVDVIQTWFFKYKVKASFVEREHVSDDTIGKHTIPENLETGEYIVENKSTIGFGDLYIVLATTQIDANKFDGGVYHGVYSGTYYIGYKLTDYAKLNSALKRLADPYGATDAVVSIFIAPEFVLNEFFNAESGTIIPGSFQPSHKEVSIPKYYSNFNEYAPKNNKLFTFPFRYLLASNNCGGGAIYKFEDFKASNGGESEQCDFDLYGSLCPGCSIKLVPKHYKNNRGWENLEESLNAAKFPICNWNTDAYTNWMTQNSINIGTSMVMSGLQIAGGVGLALTGAGAFAGGGMIASGIAGIANTVGQVKQHSMMPPQAEGNVNSGDVLAGMDKIEFTMYEMGLKSEYLRVIDNFFHMFGYKVNRVKVPNKCHRSRFWYTKTIDVNIDGAIPNKDMQIIKNAYNSGITFWRNASEIQDYSLSNSIALTEGAITD